MSADSPLKSLTDFVNAAKKESSRPEVFGIADGGHGSNGRRTAQKGPGGLNSIIPYDSGSLATASFLGKNVDGLVLALDEAIPLIQSGKVKPLAVLTEKRRTNKELKDFPTAKEQGIDLVFGQFWGLSGAPGMDPALVKWWNDRLVSGNS